MAREKKPPTDPHPAPVHLRKAQTQEHTERVKNKK